METPRVSVFSADGDSPTPTPRLRLISLMAPPWVRDMLSSGRKGTFKIVKTLAVTSTGNVQLVSYQQPDGSAYLAALKQYFKARLPPIRISQIMREAKIHSQLSHPHILPFYAAWEDSTYYNFLIKYESGGSLYAYLGRDRVLPESKAVARVIAPLLSALAYIHERRFIHRDIKLENVLVGKEGITLADFGLATSSDARAVTQVGTLNYMSLEVLGAGLKNHQDDLKEREDLQYCGMSADIWALGVLTYELLVGELPFHGRTVREVQEAIRAGLRCPEHLSIEAVDFLASVLCYDPAARPSAATLLSHPWITMHVQTAGEIQRRPMASEIQPPDGGRVKRASSSIDVRRAVGGAGVAKLNEVISPMALGMINAQSLPADRARAHALTEKAAGVTSVPSRVTAGPQPAESSGISVFNPSMKSMTHAAAASLQKAFLAQQQPGLSRGARSVAASRLPVINHSSNPDSCPSDGADDLPASLESSSPEQATGDSKGGEKRSSKFLKALGKLFRKKKEARGREDSGVQTPGRGSSRGTAEQHSPRTSPSGVHAKGRTPSVRHQAAVASADVDPDVTISRSLSQLNVKLPDSPTPWYEHLDTSNVPPTFSPVPPPQRPMPMPGFVGYDHRERLAPADESGAAGVPRVYAGDMNPNTERSVVYRLGAGAPRSWADSVVERDEAHDQLTDLSSRFPDNKARPAAQSPSNLHGSPLSYNSTSLSGRTLASVSTSSFGGGSSSASHSLYKDSLMGQANSARSTGSLKSPVTVKPPPAPTTASQQPEFTPFGVPDSK